jgi:DNA-binding Lrp family transcriptional regulator
MPKPTPIDPARISKLASYGLTNAEIADFLGISEATLKRRAQAALSTGRSQLKLRLRKKQIAVALKGNVSMLIWLGKVYLGQRESTEGQADDHLPRIVEAVVEPTHRRSQQAR